jgi:hypothetical protein
MKASRDPERNFTVLYFQHSFALEQVPDSLLIHTSGDKGYHFFKWRVTRLKPVVRRPQLPFGGHTQQPTEPVLMVITHAMFLTQ